MNIGIRKENKGKWEKRAPLAPVHVSFLISQDINVIVEKSQVRAYPDREYENAGAQISDDLNDADIILGVKEVPLDKLLPNKHYMFFSHVIKGQSHNMPMLRKMMDLNITLLDYERIVSPDGRRLVFFGPFAGNAGMIDALWGLGLKWKKKGYDTPLLEVKQTHHYYDLADAKKQLKTVGKQIEETGFPEEVGPVVIGFTGYGNVSLGAQDILNQFPYTPISPDDLLKGLPEKEMNLKTIYKLVFTLNDLYKFRNNDPFDKFIFFKSPELFESKFYPYWQKLTMLVNAVYWSEKADRMVSRENIKANRGKLDFISDISCDIDGGIELTSKATDIDSPFLSYDPSKDEIVEELTAEGLSILAVDNLPCELSIDATHFFGDALVPLLISLKNGSLNDHKNMPEELKPALILSNGRLAVSYNYLNQFL